MKRSKSEKVQCMSELATNPIVVVISTGVVICVLYCVGRCVVGCFQDFLITCCCLDPKNGKVKTSKRLSKRDVIDIIDDHLKNRSRTKVPTAEPPLLAQLKTKETKGSKKTTNELNAMEAPLPEPALESV